MLTAYPAPCNVKRQIWILNGPNLNCLGRREPEIYGHQSMEEVMLDIQRRYPDVYFTYRQSNHEGDLVDWLQEPLMRQTQGGDDTPEAIILNAGGYTHTSIALRDAVALCPVPVIEVHISDIAKREPFRHVSLLTDVCASSIIGHGTDGYIEAVRTILENG